MTSETWPSMEEQESCVKEIAIANHGSDLHVVENLLNAYLAGFRTLDSFTISEDNELEWTWLRLTTRGFNSLRCAYDLLQRGYYSQALTLIRSVNEDWLTCIDCLKHRPTLDALLQGYRMPRYAKMAERLEEPFSKEWWDGIYGEESQIAHARRRAIQVLVDPDSLTLRLGGHYDGNLFILSCYALLPVAIRMTEFLVRVLGPKGETWAHETLPIINEAKAWLKAIEAQVINADES